MTNRTTRWTCTVLGAALAGSLSCGGGGDSTEVAQASFADAVYLNGHIVTVDDTFSIAPAMAVSNGRFSAVGTDADVRALAGPATRIVDLGGRRVVNRFGDSHIHNAGGGPGVDLSAVRTIADVLAEIAARVETTEPDGVVVSNSDWHESQLEEDRLALRRELDTVAPDTSVLLVRGGHEYILNSAALEQ